MERLTTWLEALPDWAQSSLAALGLVLLAVLAYGITRRYLLRLVTRLIRRSEARWDDALLERGVLRRAASLTPLAVLYIGLPFVPGVPESLLSLVQRVLLVGLLLAAVMGISALLNAANDIYRAHPISKDRPIKGYIQLVQIFLFVMTGVLVVAVLLNKPVGTFFAAFGALTAVVLLIFRDTILSLVASIQIASYDLVRIGDWIEVPQYGADGDVIDVALHTVKVQNWDKTITTIPTYRLIEGSFKNWRGMSESGGRRIKRAIYLDATSVRFLDDEDLDRFEKFVLLRDYIRRKRKELEAYNREKLGDDPGLQANARRLTNLGTLREYIRAYLEQDPRIHHEDMTFLVRQLAPGPEGVPLEIYVFTRTTAWADYEGIQADIFDHILAIVPELGLRVFQNPTGHDLAQWAKPVR
jgi:miniconductance mechanosensitive channel